MDDYISREAAREDACDRCGKQGHCNRTEFCPVIYSVNTIPAADVIARDCYNRILAENDTMREQLAHIGKKPGDRMEGVRMVKCEKWIPIQNGKIKNWKQRCSGCGEYHRGKTDFCPHCGADMREMTT